MLGGPEEASGHMSRIDELLGGAPSGDSAEQIRSDLELLDLHLRARMERAVELGGGPGAPAWARLKAAVEKMVEADAAGDGDGMNSALAAIVASVRDGATEQGAWSELAATMKIRLQLSAQLSEMQAAARAGHQGAFALGRQIEQVQELALYGYSPRAISKALGVTPKKVQRYVRRLKDRSRGVALDVKEVTGELRARWAADRRWLRSMRGACRSVADVQRLVDAGRRIDGQEMELLRTLGILTVIGSSLLDEARAERARGETTEALELELAEKARLLLERSEQARSRAIDG